MKLAPMAFCLALAASGDEAAPTLPTGANFIPAEAQKYFQWMEDPLHWGAEKSGWHLAYSPPAQEHTFVEGGGYGESIRASLIAFNEDAAWSEWSKRKSLSFQVTVKATGLQDHVCKITASSSAFASNSYGSSWLIPTELCIHELRQHWGRLPAKIALVATLSENDLPSVSTGCVSMNLVAVAIDQASWSQRLNSLRLGQARKEVEALLGAPASIRHFMDEEQKKRTVLVYPNPDAPADLPPEKRNTDVYLDPDGYFVEYFHTHSRC